MGLFSPWFLAGALAVGLPIWLHLLKRSKQDPQEFPSLMFFEHRETSSVMHRRLDFLLLFILRCLMLLLLALLFAQPFINFSSPTASGERLTVIAVDRSFSMRTREGGTPRLDQAKEEALKIVNGLGQRTKAQVVALSGTLEAMTQQITDPNELRAAVASLKEGDSRADFGVLARYLRTLREQADVPLDVHVVSDLQKTGLPAGFTDLRLDDGTKLTLHPIGKTQQNWAVESVNAPTRIYDTKNVHISATIAGFNAPATTRNVTLILNGKTVGSKQVMVAENGRGTAEFTGLEATFGFNKCEVRIDSGDNLPADDGYAFSVERTDPKKILFIDDGRHPKSQKFFAAALTSKSDAEFTLDVLSPNVAANANYAGYAMVVLSEPNNIPSGLITRLQQYVEGGGGLLLGLGVDSVAMSKVPVIDVPIQGSKLAASTGERFWSAADVSTTHPVTRALDQLNGVKFYQAIRLGSDNSTVLAKLSDGSPLLLERKIGEGLVLAYASSFDERQNDLPYKPIYVVFVQEAVKHLAGGSGSQPVNLSVDSYVELRSGTQKGQNAEVLDPAGQRVLTIKEAEEAPNFALSREGFWDVKNAAGRRMLIAAHADRRESDLTVMDMETQQLWSSTGGEPEAPAKAQAKGDLTAPVTPWSLAPYLLMLLLVVTLAESVIANRYLRSSVAPQETMTKV